MTYHKNNYIHSSQNVQEKDIKKQQAIKFLKKGFRIQLFHGINPITNNCTCRKKDCSNPGKHPITRLNISQNKKTFKAFFIDSIEELCKELKSRPNHNYCIETGKNLVVIDVDDQAGLEYIKKEIPFIEETFTVKTKKGYHFYFHCDIKFNKIIKLNGYNVDILASGGLVLGPGSHDKKLVKDVPLKSLTREEIQKFCGNQSQSFNPTNNNPITQTKSNKQQLIKRFYSKQIKKGEYFHAFSQVSFNKLQKAYKKGYSLEDHLSWAESIALEFLDDPDVKQIKRYATNDYKNFDPKLSRNPYFQSLDKDLERFSNRNKRFLNIIFKKGFKPSTRKQRSLDGYGMTVKQVREYVKDLFRKVGMNDRLINNISDYNLMTLMNGSFPVTKALKNRKIEGTRKQSRIWGIELDLDIKLEKEINLPNNHTPEECVVIGKNGYGYIKNKDSMNQALKMFAAINLKQIDSSLLLNYNLQRIKD